MKTFLLFIVTIFSAITIFAQETSKPSYTVRVKILNEDQKPFQGVTVSLLRSLDSLLMRSALTDANGFAEIPNVKAGSYLMASTHTGFQKNYTLISVSSEDKILSIPDIILHPVTKALAAVTVDTRKPFIERRLDKLIVNVENSIVGAGSSAFEVLEKSPGVIIDQADNISLKGKTGVIIMMDGKPSPMSGSDLASSRFTIKCN